MKIFPVMILAGLCLLITFGAIFSAAMFQSASVESGDFHEAETITSHSMVSSWIYIIAVLLIIAVIIMAFKLYF